MKSQKYNKYLLSGLILIVSLTNLNYSVASTDLEDPGMRSGHTMVYDPNNEVLLLFGGIRENNDRTPLEYLWQYDIMSNNWAIVDTTNSPSPRFNHGIVYISDYNMVILFGGLNTTNHAGLSDTWIFDLETYEWREVIPPLSPPSISDTSMVYDHDNKSVILFGGFRGGVYSDQLWSFQPENETWDLQDSEYSPNPRYGSTFVFNSNNNMSYLFGGRGSQIFDDFWQFRSENNSWQKIEQEINPYSRYWHNMEYIQQKDQIFLFGGQGDTSLLSDSWIYDFSEEGWTEITSVENPEERFLASTTFCSMNNKIYLYGGMESGYTTTFGDFWEFDVNTKEWSCISCEKKTISSVQSATFISIFVGIAAIFLYNTHRFNKLNKRIRD